jgi:hypothetical protein
LVAAEKISPWPAAFLLFNFIWRIFLPAERCVYPFQFVLFKVTARLPVTINPLIKAAVQKDGKELA